MCVIVNSWHRSLSELHPSQISPKLSSVLTNLSIHPTTPALKFKEARKTKNRVSSHSDEPSLPSEVAPKKKITSKKTSNKIVHQFDEKWQLHMMRNIMLDSDLHLRILRYEVWATQTCLDIWLWRRLQPIHFDVFLEIARQYAPPGGKLKRHLRMFLDDQVWLYCSVPFLI